MASSRGTGVRQTKESDGEAAKLRQLVQTLRGDLNLLSNEAKKKYPAVRESAERGAMSLKTLSEKKGFSLKVLASTDDVVHPLLFACETKNPAIVKISLSSLQKLIQYNAIPQKSVESIVATLNGLMTAGVEELRIIQTMLLLVTSTDVVQGKSLTKVLVLCFKLYASRDPSIHSMAGVAIRQIVSALFEKVSKSTEEAGKGAEQQMPSHTRDAYLLFQDICFLTNGDPPAWLPTSLDLELALGLELLEMVLRTYPIVFVKDKIFNQLLTERVCPLIVKLFSPTSKYKAPSSRLSPTTAALLASDKPTFSLSVRLLRILNVLIREFYASLITQCEIFLSMLVKFLDSDKPLWQRTLAVEVLHAFCNQPDLLRSFCESYDMQEHSSKIFGDIIDGLGGFIQSNLTSQLIHSSLMAIMSSSPAPGVTNNSSSSHLATLGMAGSHHVHMFTIKNMSLHADFLPPNSHSKPAFLEMLEKTDIPLIPDGYPLVVAMNALLDAVKSVSLVVNEKKKSVSVELKGVMLKSSWSGVMAALALLLDACADERTTAMILESHQTYIYLCGKLKMTSPRDAFITSLCKVCLPPKYAMSLITQRGPTKTQATASSGSSSATLGGSPGTLKSDRSDIRGGNERAPPSHIMPTSSPGSSDPSLRHLGARKKLNLTEIGVGGALAGSASEGVVMGGVSGGGGGAQAVRISGSGSSVSGGTMMGGVSTPMKERDQSSSLLTVKNLHCIETLLNIIDVHGNFLDTAWPLIMTTVQHVIELFGLIPLSSGGFKKSGLTENSSLVLVNVDKRKELSEVSEKLSNLFKGSQSLSDSSVIHLIKALSQLSKNALQGSVSKELGMFPIAALLDVGNTNLNRVELIWSPITTHLSEACFAGAGSLRCFAAEALTLLIRSSLESYSEEKVQLMLLRPLESMTRVPHSDVRQKQMECITHILHSSGHSLGSSWSIILEVISSATRLQNENLVRAGFQSLQLVITDFLPAIPPSCVPSCVEVGGQYGLQTMDINISLTSIGILWNMADYLFQNRTTLQDNLESLKSQSSKASQTSLHASFVKKIQGSSLTVFDSLWMLLFKHLSDLCIDERSAVRKSACQTLFSTISAHGTLLQKETWQEVLWKVLFPLLNEVSEKAGAASTSSFQTAIMIHHSRDTAQKQWAETQVLTLTGTARLIQSRWFTLASLDGFEKAWSSFLDIIETCTLSASSEVSIAAMKSFHTIIDPQTPSPSPRSSLIHVGRHSRTPSREVTPPPTSNDKSTESQASDQLLTPSSLSASLLNRQLQMEKVPKEKRELVWTKAWNSWSSIGNRCVCKRLPSSDQIKTLFKSTKTEEIDRFFRVVPSQTFLVHLLQIFPFIFHQLRSSFSFNQFQVLSSILNASLLMPVAKDVSPFLVPSSNENKMTSLQRLVLKCFSAVYTSENVVDPEKTENSDPSSKDASLTANSLLRTRKVENIDMRRSVELNSDSCPQCVSLYPNVLTELLKCVSYVSSSPNDRLQMKGVSQSRSPMMSVNYTPFGLGAMSLAVQFYVGCVQVGVVLPRDTTILFLKTLHVPLKLKHSCPLPVVWMSSVDGLLLVLETALPSLLGSREKDMEFWRELAAILEDFLFNEVPEGVQLTAEQLREYESVDIKVIELIKRDILPVSKQAPDEFLGRLTSILNQGSIHSATDQFDGQGGGVVHLRRSAVPFRENFARVCFEALLRFSFINSQEATSIASDSTSQLALNALLKRCEEVLLKYVDDERLSGNCPLPRSRMNEVSLVLKSVTVLISSLKEAEKTAAANIDRSIWVHVAQLFPALVQCVTCTSLDVREALKEALSQFSDLMQQFPTARWRS